MKCNEKFDDLIMEGIKTHVDSLDKKADQYWSMYHVSNDDNKDYKQDLKALKEENDILRKTIAELSP